MTQFSWLLPQLPVERRARVVEHLLGRMPTLAPSLRDRLLVGLLPYVPEPLVDRCLDAAKTSRISDPQAFQTSASRLEPRQIDLALDLLEANGSRGSPQDPRLEALASVAAERLRRPNPPIARLWKLVHDTLRERAETRAEVLATLSALEPLIVGLGGPAVAVDIVRGIRRVGRWWP